jgi:hypothetical protein
MQTEALFELEASLSGGKLLGIEESLALLNEIWRLKTALTGTNMDLSYWRDCHSQAKADLERALEENRRLNEEVSGLMTLIGLPNCELENRWSNCALRRVKLLCEASAREESPKLLSWEP